MPDFVRRLAEDYGISLATFYKKWSVNQLRNITQQFNAGIRKFDVRVCENSKGEFRLCHGLFGLLTIDFILQIKEFMNKHKKEIAIVQFTAVGGLRSHGRLISLIKEHLGNILADSSKGFQTIGQMVEKNERLIVFYNVDSFTGGNIWNKKYLDSHWANVEGVDDLMKFQLAKVHEKSGNPDKFFIPQWLATPNVPSITASVFYKLNLPGQSTAVDGIPTLMKPINEKLNEFVKRTMKYRLNTLYVDIYHGVDVVALSRLLNDNCNDDKKFRSPILGGCRHLASQGRCENPDEFMKNNCKRTCSLCPKISGFSGDHCTNDSECISKKCKKSKGFCLTNAPKKIGQECGTNYQCSSGYCNEITLKCQGNFIGDKCDSNVDCQSSVCRSDFCVGSQEYKWIGLNTICNGFPDKCSLLGMSYSESSYSSSLCGSGPMCVVGRKILCSNFLQKPLSNTFWLPKDPKDVECNVSESDCQKLNATFVLKSNCGIGLSICKNDKFKILCSK
jgi:hypothetical protein